MPPRPDVVQTPVDLPVTLKRQITALAGKHASTFRIEVIAALTLWSDLGGNPEGRDAARLIAAAHQRRRPHRAAAREGGNT